MRGIQNHVRTARRLVRKRLFRDRREYFPVGWRKNIPVFEPPGKAFCDRSVAWLAGGMFAVMAVMSGGCLAAEQGHGEATLQQLMGVLAQRRHGEVPFVEEDYLAVLDRPVKSSGVLVYDAPDHLEKRTLKPKEESLVLDGDELTVRRGHRTYRLQLSSYPQVAPLVDAIRDTLAGNEQVLKRVFKVEFTGSLADWKLQLTPLDEEVAHRVRHVEIGGVRDEIRSVEILQVDGDRSVMTLGAP